MPRTALQTISRSFVAATLCLLGAQSYGAAVSGQGTWETTLQGRDLDGNAATFEAYYDTVLNITWLANANLAATNTFGVSGISAAGTMNWDTAQSWVAGMRSANYLGQSDWRLPTVIDTGALGCVGYANAGTDCGYNVDLATSEMAQMFYSTLGNAGIYDPTGVPSGCSVSSPYCLTNTGPFANLDGPFSSIQANYYWSGTQYPSLDHAYAWVFGFSSGLQTNEARQANYLHTWAVRDGDVTAVPAPPAVWLLGTGCVALFGRFRRKVTAA